MEGLGWWIYLCSVAGGILVTALAIFIVCLAALLITSAAYCSDECELKTAKKWWKYTGIIGVISMIFFYLDSFKIYLLPNFWSYSCNRSN